VKGQQAGFSVGSHCSDRNCTSGCELDELNSIGSLSKFRSCYDRCIKLFHGYKKYDSVTSILFEAGLPSSDTVYVTMPSLLCLHDGCLAATQWSPCCVHVCHVNLCVLVFFLPFLFLCRIGFFLMLCVLLNKSVSRVCLMGHVACFK